MSLQVEKLEHNMAKLTIEVPAEELEKAIEGAYQKNKKNIALPGFRKGKAPRKMVERMYGKGVFLEDAANDLIPEAYSKAVDESDLEIVSYPSIDVTQIEAGQPFIFTAEVALKPDIVLGEYKGIEVEKPDDEVKEDEIQAELIREQEQNSRLVAVEDRAAENGDIVTIDYEGFVDGESFAGGKATDYPLTLGSGAFIPGFEEQLVGVRTDEDVELHVTFPENYGNDELSGKDAVFKCTVHKIEHKELPELDDEFAQDVSEFDTMEEYKADIRKRLTEEKEAEGKRKKGNDAIVKIVENSQIDIPDAMLETQKNQQLDDFSRRLQMQGMLRDQYLRMAQMTQEQLENQMEERAKENIQNRLVLEKIAEVENIQPTQEQVDEEIKKTAEAYHMDIEKVRDMLGDKEMEQMKQDLAVQQAFDLIADNAVAV